MAAGGRLTCPEVADPAHRDDRHRGHLGRLLVVGVVVFGMLAMLGIAATAGSPVYGSGFGAAGPVSAPSEPGELGVDATLDELAIRCFDGDMGACDGLYHVSEPFSDYEAYAEACGGRVEPGDVYTCLEVE